MFNLLRLHNTYVLMFEESDVDSQVLEAMVSGFQVTILESSEPPIDEYWWYVESPSGNRGWVQEIADGERILFTADALLDLTPTAAPTSMPTPSPISVTRLTGTVSANRLNVRIGPGPEYDQVTELVSGTAVIVVGRNEDATWIQLDTADQQWINARFVDVVGDIRVLPVAFNEIGEWDVAGQPTGVQAVAETVLRVRGGPGNEYRQLSNPDTLDAGTVVDIVGVSADGLFYKVNIGSQSAWINAQYVRLTGNTSAQIPVVFMPSSQTVEISATATPQAFSQTSPILSPDQCPGSLPQRLYVGGQAQQILSENPVRVQNEPGGGTTVFLVYPRAIVDVIDGPQCQNIGNSPTSWWQIRGTNNWTGWVAEGAGSDYYFQPHEG